MRIIHEKHGLPGAVVNLAHRAARRAAHGAVAAAIASKLARRPCAAAAIVVGIVSTVTTGACASWAALALASASVRLRMAGRAEPHAQLSEPGVLPTLRSDMKILME